MSKKRIRFNTDTDRNSNPDSNSGTYRIIYTSCPECGARSAGTHSPGYSEHTINARPHCRYYGFAMEDILPVPSSSPSPSSFVVVPNEVLSYYRSHRSYYLNICRAYHAGTTCHARREAQLALADLRAFIACW